MMLRKTLVTVGLLAMVAVIPSAAFAATSDDAAPGTQLETQVQADVADCDGEGNAFGYGPGDGTGLAPAPADGTGYGPGDGTCDCDGVPAGDGLGYQHGRDN